MEESEKELGSVKRIMLEVNCFEGLLNLWMAKQLSSELLRKKEVNNEKNGRDY